MRVLAVASEIYPLVKTGGLADVTGALPLALAAHGVAVRTLVPGYPAVLAAAGQPRKPVALPDLFGHRARLIAATVAGLDLLILDAPGLFARDGGPYGDAAGTDWPDNWQRFAALGQTAAHVAAGRAKWTPDLVHAHDWQAGMALAYLRYGASPAPPSVMTIHNLAFQGRFPAAIFAALGLPAAAASVDGIEYYGGIGYLKAGLQAADAITTVSPTYAREIATAENGMGLEGLMVARAADLHGILNGIDADVWNPAADPLLPARYGPRHLARRARNRRAVAERFGLDPGHAGPLLCVVSRLTWQKGMDVLAAALDDLVGSGASLAVLGSGDAMLEGAFLAAANRHPGRIAVVIGYDEPLSHLLQGGADAILIPSRFEPCGLTQLYGLRYGCVPVVTRTGGLADTVIDANEAALAAGVATGFVLSGVDPAALRHGFARIAAAFADPTAWATIQRRGMKADNSWSRSAALHATLYRDLIERRATR